MYTLYKVRVKLMYTLYNDLTIFSKKWLKSGLFQFLTMWILWDRKCEYWFFHITHAKNSSNHSSSTRDLTRFLGICDVEKPILTFPPHSILSLLTWHLSVLCKKYYHRHFHVVYPPGNLIVASCWSPPYQYRIPMLPWV